MKILKHRYQVKYEDISILIVILLLSNPKNLNDQRMSPILKEISDFRFEVPVWPEIKDAKTYTFKTLEFLEKTRESRTTTMKLKPSLESAFSQP